MCHLEESQLEFRNSQFVINYDILMNGKTKIRDFTIIYRCMEHFLFVLKAITDIRVCS